MPARFLPTQLDKQRRESDFQRELGNAAKKLRSQKLVSDQLQRTLQEERLQRTAGSNQYLTVAGADTGASRRGPIKQAPNFQTNMFPTRQPFF